jgi:hypothetical protein
MVVAMDVAWVPGITTVGDLSQDLATGFKDFVELGAHLLIRGFLRIQHHPGTPSIAHDRQPLQACPLPRLQVPLFPGIQWRQPERAMRRMGTWYVECGFLVIFLLRCIDAHMCSVCLGT